MSIHSLQRITKTEKQGTQSPVLGFDFKSIAECKSVFRINAVLPLRDRKLNDDK